MNCPRCKGRMHSDYDQGTLDQGDVVSVQCVKCINCGHRVYPEVKVEMPFAQNMKLPKQAYLIGCKPGRKPSHQELMQKYYKSIGDLRKGANPASWDSIARLIKTAEGVKICGRSVREYYESISSGKVKQ